MKKFKKLVAMEPVSLVPWAWEELRQYADEIVTYPDVPAGNDEILKRIAGADAVLLSYTSRLEGSVMEQCPELAYVGMCCSLYSKESANVDISAAEKLGVAVTGIRDYGDRGVVEYVLCELIRHLHGYDRPMWKDKSVELTGLKVGLVGLGVSGGMLAEALHFMGSEVRYFCRGPKEKYEAMGIRFTPLKELLAQSEVVLCCLNKNVLLLGPEEFQALGEGKILFNTSIGPAFDPADLAAWLEESPENRFCCDTLGALGESTLAARRNVWCVDASAGMTRQAYQLLSRKVLDNIRDYLRR